jgi:DNA-binding transcriptional regulator YiaG
MNRCPECKSRELRPVLKEETAQVEFRFRGTDRVASYVTRLPVTRCRACGQEFETGADLERFELHVARAALDMGVLAGGILRYARKALGLRATDLAELLGVTAETVSHWENDRTEISRAAWVAIGDLVEDRINGVEATRNRLAAFGKPRVPSGPVVLSLAPAEG